MQVWNAIRAVGAITLWQILKGLIVAAAALVVLLFGALVAVSLWPNSKAPLVEPVQDIVYLNQGAAEPRGHTDLERLATGELVYTGARRTPICAVLGMEVASVSYPSFVEDLAELRA